jgi:hypothetical protein
LNSLSPHFSPPYSSLLTPGRGYVQYPEFIVYNSPAHMQELICDSQEELSGAVVATTIVSFFCSGFTLFLRVNSVSAAFRQTFKQTNKQTAGALDSRQHSTFLFSYSTPQHSPIHAHAQAIHGRQHLFYLVSTPPPQ